MAEVISGFGGEILSVYNSLISALPPFAGKFISLFLLALFVVLYAVFIWKFYRFIAKKNILELNLNQYNKYEHPFLDNLFTGIFYFLEYMVILPFLIFFWFSVFTLFLIFLTEDLDISVVLIISATIIAAIRMTAYYNEDLSKDLAKLLPFTLLAIAITTSGFFNMERIIGHFSQLPTFFGDIIIYLGFIVILEVILRFFDFILSLFGLEED